MRICLPLLLFFFGVAELVAGSFKDRDAPRHVGETAEVHGKVYDVHLADSGLVLLNFGGKYPAQTFTVVILPVNAPKFLHLEKLNGATISVHGQITQHKDKPEMILESPDQLRVLIPASSPTREIINPSPASVSPQSSSTVIGPDGVERRILPMSRTPVP